MLSIGEVEERAAKVVRFFHVRKGDGMAGYVYLEVDASELEGKIDRLKSVCTPEQFERVMAGIFRRTGGHVRRILKSDLPHQYVIKAGEVGKAVGNAKVSGGTSCIIPVRGPRRVLGPKGFAASGGAHGWNSLRRKYRVKAKIVTAGTSTLPSNAGSYGGQPPFRNLSAPRLNGITFTRAGGSRFPIRKMEGIAIPQMPMNRSEPEVQRDILDYMEKRIEHEFMRVLSV